jgi:hypothetical protein
MANLTIQAGLAALSKTSKLSIAAAIERTIATSIAAGTAALDASAPAPFAGDSLPPGHGLDHF